MAVDSIETKQTFNKYVCTKLFGEEISFWIPDWLAWCKDYALDCAISGTIIAVTDKAVCLEVTVLGKQRQDWFPFSQMLDSPWVTCPIRTYTPRKRRRYASTDEFMELIDMNGSEFF